MMLKPEEEPCQGDVSGDLGEAHTRDHFVSSEDEPNDMEFADLKWNRQPFTLSTKFLQNKAIISSIAKRNLW